MGPRLSYDELQQLLENINDVIWKLDLELKYTYVSPSCTKIIGFTPEERMSQRLESQMTPQSYQRAMALFAEELAREKESGSDPLRTVRIELEYFHKDGRTLWFENVVTWDRSEDGTLIGLQGVSRDITERRLADGALAESENKFRLVFNTCPDSIKLNRLEDGTYLDINDGFSLIMGYTREEVIGNTSIELNIWNNTDDRKNLVDVLKQNGYVKNFEAEYVRKDGSILVGLTSARFLEMKGENIVISMTRDITERKQTEKSLIESEERFRGIAESMADWIWEVDSEGRYTYCSDHVAEILGYGPDEILGKTPFDFMAPDQASVHYENFRTNLINKSVIKDLENWNIHKDGQKICLLTNGVPILNERKDLIGYRGVDKDITERKRAENELKKHFDNLKIIFDSAPNILALVDEEVRVEMINRQGRLLVGQDGEIFSGALCGDLFNCVNSFKGGGCGRNQDCLMCPIRTRVRSTFETGEPCIEEEGQLTFLLKDRETSFDFLISTRLFDMESKKLVVLSLTDISQTKNALRALKESEEKFRLAYLTSPDSINLNRLDDGMYIDINEGFTSTMGFSREDVIGKTSLELNIWKNPGDRERLRNGLSEKGYVENLEAEFVGKDGRIRYGLMSARILTINDEQVIISITRDITEKKLKERLKETQLRLIEQSIHHSTAELLQLLLDEAETFTESTVGFYQFVEEDQINVSLETWSTRALTAVCRAAESGVHYSTEQGRVWEDFIRDGKPLIHNDDGRSSDTIGFFPEHLHIVRQIVVPVVRGGKTVAILGVGNKSSNYLQRDVETIQQLADLAWETVVRKRSEEALKKSEELHRSILRTAMDGFWLTDKHGNLLEVNRMYCQMSGYGLDELLTMKIFDLEAGESVPEVYDRIQKIAEIGQDRFESMHRRKDGSMFDVEVSVQYRKSDDGRFVFFLRDISKQKKAIKALKASNEKMKLAADAAQFGIWELDIAGNRLEWDDWMFRLYGTNRERHPDAYAAWQAGVHPDDLAGSRKAIEQALSGREKNESEFRIVRSDGEVRHLKAYANVSCDSRGNPIQMTGITYDITDRVEAIKDLKESEERFRALHNASFGGIAIHDRGLILECNKGMSDITGYDYHELIGMNGLYLISDGTRDMVIEHIKSGYEKAYEAMGVRKNGEVYPLRLEARNIPYKGKTVRVVEFRDITENTRTKKEKEELEKKLRQAQKMESIGNLAGGIAHDFNNILFPIVGMAEMLVEDLPQGSTEQENANEILQAGKRGAELVQQILAFSRQHDHRMSPTRLQGVMREVLKLTRSSIPADIEMTQFLQSDCGLILADSTQLHQVGMNLITNAYHAVQHKGGKIHVEVRETDIKEGLQNPNIPPGKYATLTVTDNNESGIPKEHLDKIFEPYFTTKEKGKGTGLGLSVVYGIVKEHKGEIKVTSDSGNGTSFRIYIPVMVTATVKKHGSNTSTQPTGSEHILLVDDEAPITNLESQMLERLGYQVSKQTSSVGALETFMADPTGYDLLITDMSMPYMTGDQLAQAILNIRPDFPIIICTGFSERINQEEAREMGVKGFLMKPVVKADLAKEVRRVLDDI